MAAAIAMFERRRWIWFLACFTALITVSNTVPPLLTDHLGTQDRSSDDWGFRMVGVLGVGDQTPLKKKLELNVTGNNVGSWMCMYHVNFILKHFTNRCLWSLCLQVIINQRVLANPVKYHFV